MKGSLNHPIYHYRQHQPRLKHLKALILLTLPGPLRVASRRHPPVDEEEESSAKRSGFPYERVGVGGRVEVGAKVVLQQDASEGGSDFRGCGCSEVGE